MGTATARKSYPRPRKRDESVSVKPPEVNDSVDIWWDEDHCFYRGTLTRRHPGHNMFRIEYDDGDMEDIDMSNEFWQYPSNAQPKQAASNDSRIEDVVVDGSDAPGASLRLHRNRARNKPNHKASRRVSDRSPANSRPDVGRPQLANNATRRDRKKREPEPPQASSVQREKQTSSGIEQNEDSAKELKRDVQGTAVRQPKPSLKTSVQQKEPSNRAKQKIAKSRKAAILPAASSTLMKQKTVENRSDILWPESGQPPHSTIPKDDQAVDKDCEPQKATAANKSANRTSADKGTLATMMEKAQNHSLAAREMTTLARKNSNSLDLRSPGVGETRGSNSNSIAGPLVEDHSQSTKVKSARAKTMKIKKILNKSSRSAEQLDSVAHEALLKHDHQSTRSNQSCGNLTHHAAASVTTNPSILAFPTPTFLDSNVDARLQQLAPVVGAGVVDGGQSKKASVSSAQKDRSQADNPRMDMTSSVAQASVGVHKNATQGSPTSNIHTSHPNISLPPSIVAKDLFDNPKKPLPVFPMIKYGKFAKHFATSSTPPIANNFPPVLTNTVSGGSGSGIMQPPHPSTAGPSSAEQKSVSIPLRVRLSKTGKDKINHKNAENGGSEVNINVPTKGTPFHAKLHRRVEPKDMVPHYSKKRSSPDAAHSSPAGDIVTGLNVTGGSSTMPKRTRVESDSIIIKYEDVTTKESFPLGSADVAKLLDARLAPFESRVEECVKELKAVHTIQLNLSKGQDAFKRLTEKWQAKQWESVEKLCSEVQTSRLQVRDTMSATIRELEGKLTEHITSRVTASVKEALKQFEQTIIQSISSKCSEKIDAPAQTLHQQAVTIADHGLSQRISDKQVAPPSNRNLSQRIFPVVQDISGSNPVPEEAVQVRIPPLRDGERVLPRDSWRRVYNEDMSAQIAEPALLEASSAIRERVKHLVARQVTVWLLETPHEYNPQHSTFQQWARRSSSEAFMAVYSQLRRFGSFEQAFETLSASLGNDAVELSWFIQPGCVDNLHLARRNYGAWDPPPTDEEWKGELILLRELSERFRNVLDHYVIKDGSSTLIVAGSVANLAAQDVLTEKGPQANPLVSIGSHLSSSSAAMTARWHNTVIPGQGYRGYRDQTRQ